MSMKIKDLIISLLDYPMDKYVDCIITMGNEATELTEYAGIDNNGLTYSLTESNNTKHADIFLEELTINKIIK